MVGRLKMSTHRPMYWENVDRDWEWVLLIRPEESDYRLIASTLLLRPERVIREMNGSLALSATLANPSFTRIPVWKRKQANEEVLHRIARVFQINRPCSSAALPTWMAR